MRAASIIGIIGLCSLALTGPATAQGKFTGTWTIVSASIAPWVGANYPGDEAEARRLLGQTVRFETDAVTAPLGWLSCRKPRYEFRQAEANSLFEGNLTHDGADRSLDAVAEARKLGITERHVTAMLVICEEGLEFFLTGPDAILFGLNNRIYRLQRKP